MMITNFTFHIMHISIEQWRENVVSNAQGYGLLRDLEKVMGTRRACYDVFNNN